MDRPSKYRNYKWEEIFEDFKASGLARQPYCKRHNIHLSTFKYAWERIVDGKPPLKRKKPSKPSFVKVKVEKTEKELEAPSFVVLLPNGIKLLDFPASGISCLIKLPKENSNVS